MTTGTSQKQMCCCCCCCDPWWLLLEVSLGCSLLNVSFRKDTSLNTALKIRGGPAALNILLSEDFWLSGSLKGSQAPAFTIIIVQSATDNLSQTASSSVLFDPFCPLFVPQQQDFLRCVNSLQLSMRFSLPHISLHCEVAIYTTIFWVCGSSCLPIYAAKYTLCLQWFVFLYKDTLFTATQCLAWRISWFLLTFLIHCSYLLPHWCTFYDLLKIELTSRSSHRVVEKVDGRHSVWWPCLCLLIHSDKDVCWSVGNIIRKGIFASYLRHDA